MFSNVFHKFIQPCSAPTSNLYEHMTLWCNVSHKCFNLLTNLTKQKNNPCHYIRRGSPLVNPCLGILIISYLCVFCHTDCFHGNGHKLCILVAKAGKFEVTSLVQVPYNDQNCFPCFGFWLFLYRPSAARSLLDNAIEEF